MMYSLQSKLWFLCNANEWKLLPLWWQNDKIGCCYSSHASIPKVWCFHRSGISTCFLEDKCLLHKETSATSNNLSVSFLQRMSPFTVILRRKERTSKLPEFKFPNLQGKVRSLISLGQKKRDWLFYIQSIQKLSQA